MTLAETICRFSYNKSADVNDPQNANKDWRAGYAEGLVSKGNSLELIAAEWRERNEPSHGKAAEEFREWKAGLWAGTFTRLDNNIGKNNP